MPLLNVLKDSIIDHDIASMDATTLQVLNESGRNPAIKSYAYCFRGGGEKKPLLSMNIMRRTANSLSNIGLRDSRVLYTLMRIHLCYFVVITALCARFHCQAL